MTAQFSNTIVVDGQEQQLLADPMAGFFSKYSRPPFCATSSANRRGYTTEWEVRGKSLYLVGLEGVTCVRKADAGVAPGSWCKVGHRGPCIHQAVSLADLTGSVPNGVFADWVSEELRLASGDIVKYVHAGWGSKFEREEYLTFRVGRLVRRRRPGMRRTLENLLSI